MDEEVRSYIRYLSASRDYQSLLIAMTSTELNALGQAIRVEQSKRKKEQQIKRATIKVEIEETAEGTPICLSKTCPLKRECANHDSAGDYRSEDGFTPNLHKIKDDWFCEQKETSSYGMLVNENGNLVAWRIDRQGLSHGRGPEEAL